MSSGGIIFLFLIPVVTLGLWKIKFNSFTIVSLVVPGLLILMLLVTTTSAVWKTDEARRLYAQGAVDLIAKKPLTGHGLDTFLEGSKQVALGDRNVDRVHHIFLDMAYSMGIPLALCAFLFLIAVVVTSRDKRSFMYSLPILIFLITTVVHTKSAYHYVELSLFLGLWLVAYLDKDSSQYK
jgi:O-antigen ligase